jgi:collagen triple helix repeat protein
MFSTLRNRFGIPGVISVIALVFAMFGGAYAASNSSGGGKATVSAKAKKGPRGPKGATGPAGPAGPQGPAGANGKDGAAGKAGANGTNGDPGADGKSVITTPINVGDPGCNTLGGTEVEVEGSGQAEEVCNGEEGAQGAQGDPWTAGGTLPPGDTETGAWSWGTYSVTALVEYVPVSFSVPLAAPLGASRVHYVPGSVTVGAGGGDLTSGSVTVTGVTLTSGKYTKASSIFGAGIPAGATITACVPTSCKNVTELTLSSAAETSGTGVSLTTGPPAGCTGGTRASPKADSGNLCVYEANSVGTTFQKIVDSSSAGLSIGAGTAGALVGLEGSTANISFAIGTWAVTG